MSTPAESVATNQAPANGAVRTVIKKGEREELLRDINQIDSIVGRLPEKINKMRARVLALEVEE